MAVFVSRGRPTGHKAFVGTAFWLSTR